MRSIYSELRLFNQTQCGRATCFKDKHKPLAMRGHPLFKTVGGLLGDKDSGHPCPQPLEPAGRDILVWKGQELKIWVVHSTDSKNISDLCHSHFWGWALYCCRLGAVNDAGGELRIFAVSLQRPGAKLGRRELAGTGVGNQESKRYFITVCTVAGGGSSFTPAAKIPTCPKLKHWRRDILNLCTCCV